MDAVAISDLLADIRAALAEPLPSLVSERREKRGGSEISLFLFPRPAHQHLTARPSASPTTPTATPHTQADLCPEHSDAATQTARRPVVVVVREEGGMVAADAPPQPPPPPPALVVTPPPQMHQDTPAAPSTLPARAAELAAAAAAWLADADAVSGPAGDATLLAVARAAAGASAGGEDECV